MSADGDMFDFEVDAELLPRHFGDKPRERDRNALIASLAAEACAAWWLRAKQPKRDTIARAFAAPQVANRHSLKTHEFAAFRSAWIAEFRRLGCSEPECPETFFAQPIECHCRDCTAQRAARNNQGDSHE